MFTCPVSVGTHTSKWENRHKNEYRRVPRVEETLRISKVTGTAVISDQNLDPSGLSEASKCLSVIKPTGYRASSEEVYVFCLPAGAFVGRILQERGFRKEFASTDRVLETFQIDYFFNFWEKSKRTVCNAKKKHQKFIGTIFDYFFRTYFSMFPSVWKTASFKFQKITHIYHFSSFYFAYMACKTFSYASRVAELSREPVKKEQSGSYMAHCSGHYLYKYVKRNLKMSSMVRCLRICQVGDLENASP